MVWTTPTRCQWKSPWNTPKAFVATRSAICSVLLGHGSSWFILERKVLEGTKLNWGTDEKHVQANWELFKHEKHDVYGREFRVRNTSVGQKKYLSHLKSREFETATASVLSKRFGRFGHVLFSLEQNYVLQISSLPLLLVLCVVFFERFGYFG